MAFSVKKSPVTHTTSSERGDAARLRVKPATMAEDGVVKSPNVSKRVIATDAPVIVTTKALMSQAPPGKQVLSLAQGVVHWHPPPAATAIAAQLLTVEGAADGAISSGGGMRAVYGVAGVHSYGPADGLPALKEALEQKVASRNGLPGYEVMVTSGANQAFLNLVLALCDAQDKVVLFKPYYFNHIMALQMTGGAAELVLGPSNPNTLHPDWEWLQQELQGPSPPRVVVVVNPCNPTGILLPKEELQAAADMCKAAGTWLVLDNTYEDFVYEGREHHSVAGPNVVSLFSFSKAYGMMGWRVGYIAYPGQQVLADIRAQDCCLRDQLLKVQDTIAICPSQLSQHMALAALQQGGSYVQDAIAALSHNRALIADALSPLGTEGHGWVGGEGAIYFWAKLPDCFSTPPATNKKTSAATRQEPSITENKHNPPTSSTSSSSQPTGNSATDEDVVAWLIRQHGVCVIPGSACGVPGYIRVAFANLTPAKCEVAAGRLKAGLKELISLQQLPKS